jgi:DNA-binding response OmpR family regulator
MTGRKILIIDDDPHPLMGLAARLRGSGYRVICATDAISGIALAQKETPDLIILDLGLPRDEGFDLMEQKRKLTELAAIPVIVLTARDPVNNDKLALEAGAVFFFQKPHDNSQFLSAIRQTLGEPTGLSTFLQT